MSDTDYKQKIIEMVEEINTPKFLKMIYGFVRAAHREEVSNNGIQAVNN